MLNLGQFETIFSVENSHLKESCDWVGKTSLSHKNISKSKKTIKNYLIKLRGHTVSGRVWVGLVKERLYGGEDGRHVVCWGPTVLQDVQADTTVSVNVRVEHFAHKSD